MKAVYSYLATDGVCHTWDVANRGGTPLCGDDVFPVPDQRATLNEPMSCLACAELLRVVLEWEDFQERG